MISVTTQQTVGLDEKRPDKYCATGYGDNEKCDCFQHQVHHWPLIGVYETPYCERYGRRLKRDGESVLREHLCVRDFGNGSVPGRYRTVDVPTIDGRLSMADGRRRLEVVESSNRLQSKYNEQVLAERNSR